MAVSAAFTFTGASGSLAKRAVSASSTVTATLDNLAGVDTCEWEIATTDETSEPGDYTLALSGSKDSVCDTTSLTAGTAAILGCIVNRGRPDEARAKAKFGVLTAAGLWVGCFDEEFEHDSVYGSTEIANAAVRSASAAVAGSVTDVTAGSNIAVTSPTPTTRQVATSATPSFTRVTLSGDATTARTVGTEASGRVRVYESSALRTVPHFDDISGISPYRYYYPSGIAAGTELTPPIWIVDQGRFFDCNISFQIYPSAALTADDTDYAAIEILNEAGTVIFLAETTLTSDNATGNWADDTPMSIATLADPNVFTASLAQVSGMKLRVRKINAGIALPAFTLVPYFSYVP